MMNILRAVQRVRGGESFSRRHQRFELLMPVRLRYIDEGYDVDGFLNEISLGGARFRPEQSYLLRRAAAMVTVIAGDLEIMGTLRNASPQGYGIQFLSDLDEAVLAGIVSDASAVA